MGLFNPKTILQMLSPIKPNINRNFIRGISSAPRRGTSTGNGSKINKEPTKATASKEKKETAVITKQNIDQTENKKN